VRGRRADERAETSTGGSAGIGGGPASTTGDDEHVRVVVLVRADCRTCDRMEDVVREMCLRAGEEYRRVDVDAPDADPEWRAEYSDAIPVVLVDDVEIGSWRVEPADLARALAEPHP
jgi:hypothetical protein